MRHGGLYKRLFIMHSAYELLGADKNAIVRMSK